MTDTNQVVSIRPAFLEVAQPSFVPSVTSSPANVYLQTVDAQSHDARRMSWVFRSPSSGLILSPLAYAKFQIKITAPYKMNRADMVGTLLGAIDDQVAANGRTTGMVPAVGMRAGYGYRPLLLFGEGNTVQNATESLQISINGATWSELNGNLYSRSLSRCFEPLDVQQRAYSTCGGSCLAFDDTPVSGHCLGLPDNLAIAVHGVGINNLVALAGADLVTDQTGYRAIEGLTMDSSLAQRQDNFYDQIVKSAAIADTGQQITIEVRFPIQGGPFNSLWGASGLSRADPRLRMALGIPNYNQGQITYNFKDLIKHVVRRLGRPSRSAGANAVVGNVSNHIASDIQVTYDSSYVPQLELTWIRMPAYRSYPQSSAITIYRRDVRRSKDQTVGKKTFAAGLFDSGSALTGLQCASGLSGQPSANTIRPASATIVGAEKHQAKVVFNGLQFPQVPNHLFIVFEKSSEVYNLNNPLVGVDRVSPPDYAGNGYQVKWEQTDAARTVFNTDANANAALMNKNANLGDAQADADHAFNQECAGRFISQNQSSNASILMLEITVQSAVGSWSFRSQASYPHLADRDQLWQKHVQNCCDGYMKAGRGKWAARASCALLSCSDFLLGLSTGPGVVFPIILDITVQYANRAGVSSGACFTTGQTKGKQVFDDFIVGTPVVVGLFNQQILSIASSSAVVSAQAFSQSTFASAVSQQG